MDEMVVPTYTGPDIDPPQAPARSIAGPRRQSGSYTRHLGAATW
jgi:hypothetical protein